MEPQVPSNNGEDSNSIPDHRNPSHVETVETLDPDRNHSFVEEIDSSCSTPYVSAPSSPGRGPVGFFYSAPASPMHFVLSDSCSLSRFTPSSTDVNGSSEFEFSARFCSNNSNSSGSMSSADELFLNGQIRPMKLSTHLQRPQVLAPLLDLEVEEEENDNDKEFSESGCGKRQEVLMRGRDLRFRDRSLRRRTRSMSPLRNSPFGWHEDYELDRREQEKDISSKNDEELQEDESKDIGSMSKEATPTISASSSRSSSAGRSSKRWIFLKEFLYRSKSEGRSPGRFWTSISFSPVKEKLKEKNTTTSSTNTSSTKETTTPGSVTLEKQKVKQSVQNTKGKAAGKSSNGGGKRRIPPSPHELHYTANRAQAEELRKKTFLPYRQGLLGCLGFSSKGYGAMNGLARALNPVSSR